MINELNKLLDLWETVEDYSHYYDMPDVCIIEHDKLVVYVDDIRDNAQQHNVSFIIKRLLVDKNKPWYLEYVDGVYMSYINKQGNNVQYGRSDAESLLRSYLEDLGVELPQYADPELKRLNDKI